MQAQPSSANDGNIANEAVLPGVEAAILQYTHALLNATGRRRTQDAPVDMVGLAALEQLPEPLAASATELPAAVVEALMMFVRDGLDRGNVATSVVEGLSAQLGSSGSVEPIQVQNQGEQAAAPGNPA